MVSRISCSTVSSKNASAFDTGLRRRRDAQQLWLPSCLAIDGDARRDRQNHRQEEA